MSGAIEHPRYQEIVELLKADPIIIGMFEELRTTGEKPSDLTSEEGTPLWAFMQSSLETYKKRGGQIPSHLGGPARAILQLMQGT